VTDEDLANRKSVLAGRLKIGAVCLGLALAALLLFLWAKYASPVSTPVPLSNADDPFYKAIQTLLGKNAWDIDLLIKANVLVQTMLVVAALGGTVLAALTTSETASKYKGYSIALTLATAAAALFLSAFHVRENLAVFVKIEEDLNIMESAYLRERRPFESEATNNKGERTVAVRNDDALLAIQQKYVAQLSGYIKNRSLAWANIGIQGAGKGDPGKPE
jgi:hypothetical protein